ncbi:MAG: 1,4-dihydroxy-2-naphthoate octaprenyltransferase [Hyphomicrobiales bacterium]|mgnify:CR=1 FL=1|nr:MAG: 1,4-dihydroxy-2-naphthoate octaprenyltransferase [Hyphomicrobiales bacterium]
MDQRVPEPYSIAVPIAVASVGNEAARRATPEPVSALTAWVMAFRPKTLTLSVSPVAAGAFWAWFEAGALRPFELAFALLGALAIQIGTNLWNDACDGERGHDTADRLGPPRVTALGILPAATVRMVALGAFAVAIAAGIVLLAAGGLPIAIVGAVSILCGLAYSSGPRPISASPYGELFVLLFFGIVAVGGTYYLQTGMLTASTVALGAIVGLPAAAVLLVNNHRDRVSDSRAGRRTLAIVAGVATARTLYAVLMVATVLFALAFVQPNTIPAMAAFVPLAAITIVLIRDMAATPVSRELNRTLARTALSQAALAITIAMSVLLCAPA